MMQLPADCARRQVGDALYQALLRAPGPVRPAALLRSLPPETGLDQTTARMVLEEEPRLVLTDKGWGLRILATLSGGAFIAGAAALTDDLGEPLETPLVASAFARATGKAPAYYQSLLDKLLARQDAFAQVDGKLVPREWLLFPEGEGEDDVLFYCDLDEALIDELRPVCGDDALRGETPLDTAATIIAAAPGPVPNKILGFFVYRLHVAEFDAEALLSAMWRDSRFLALPGLRWVSGGLRRQLQAAMTQLIAAAAAHEPEDAVDLETLLAEPLPPDEEGYFLEDRDIDAIYEVLAFSKTAVAVGELLAEVLGLQPQNPRYLTAAHSVRGLLREDPSVLDVGVSRFLGQGGIPAWAREMPSGMMPLPGVEGPDVILQEEGLRPGLPGKVHDPFYEDVGDDDVTVGRDDYSEDETYWALPYHHRVAGSLKLRKMDERLLALGAPITPVTLLGAAGGEHMAWANLELGVILGLGPVYERLDLQPGSLLSLTPADSPGRFVLQVAGEDEATAIPAKRLVQLRVLAAEFSGQAPGVFELMQRVMAEYPQGIHFEALWSQMNVVRRTSRLQVASLLSYYQCFRPKDSEGNEWAFAPDAVAAGPVGTKQKYVIG